jgi:hypothetical protein
MESYILSRGFIRCRSDPNVYMMRSLDSLVLIVIHIDDLLIIGSSTSYIVAVKAAFHDMISITYLYCYITLLLLTSTRMIHESICLIPSMLEIYLIGFI